MQCSAPHGSNWRKRLSGHVRFGSQIELEPAGAACTHRAAATFGGVSAEQLGSQAGGDSKDNEFAKHGVYPINKNELSIGSWGVAKHPLDLKNQKASIYLGASSASSIEVQKQKPRCRLNRLFGVRPVPLR
jgi:hypothetical protein